MYKPYLLLLSFLLGGCTFLSENNWIPLPPSEPPPVTKSSQPSLPDLELAVHQQVNDYRASKNLPPLKLDPRISEQCRIHSQAMANGEVPFSHQGAEIRFQNIRKQILWREIGENVAFNFGYPNPGKEAVRGWIESPGHRRNMEGNFDLAGMGIVKNAKGEYDLTQIFVKKLW